MKLGKELAKQAKRFNICQKGIDELDALSDREAIVKMYLKSLEFCLSNDYPSNDFLCGKFGDMINDYGIFVDNKIDLVNTRKCVALGATKGRVEINGYGVSEIFVKHGSELTIIAKDNAFVMVDAFDDTTVHIRAKGRSKVCVNRYGDAKITQMCDGATATVKIVEKNKKSYL